MVRYADSYLDLHNDPNVMDFGCADESTVLEKPDRQKRDSAP